MYYLLMLFLMLMSCRVWAEEIVVTKAFCDQYMIEHVPDDDVAYKPDANLDMGPPADIGGAITIKPPTDISIPLELNLNKYKGRGGWGRKRSGNNKYTNDVYLGEINILEDGRVYYNDQPLFHEDEFAIKQACRQLKKK
jgi:hypothetical protein